MNEERRRVLDMLSEGKLTVEEAERLLVALQGTHRSKTRKRRGTDASLSPIPRIEVQQDSFEGLGKSRSEWSESENGARDKHGKAAMREDAFEVGTNPRLVVRGFNGRIRVHAGEPGSIRVRTRLKSPCEIEYSTAQEGDLVSVEAKPDRQSEGRHSGANIEVAVPVTTSVDLATSKGLVELRGTEGSGTVQTKNGRIRVENFKGNLNATTENSPIAVKTFQGSADLATLNGRVSIEDARGRFDARTTNGTIKFQGRFEPKSHNSLSTSNGNIKVVLDADSSLELTAATVNGRVRCEVPGLVASVEKRHKQLKGAVGKGEAELVAKTVNGSIAIQ